MNLSHYSKTKQDATYAIVGSIIVHLLFVLCLLFWFVRRPDQVIETFPEKETYVLLSPEMFQRPPEVVETPKVEEKKQFTQTDSSQPERVPEKETKRIGNQNTRAASETILDSGDPNLPSQVTSNVLPSERMKTMNSDYRKERAKASVQPTPNIPSETAEVQKPVQEQIAEKVPEVIAKKPPVATPELEPKPTKIEAQQKLIQSKNQIATAKKSSPERPDLPLENTIEEQIPEPPKLAELTEQVDVQTPVKPTPKQQKSAKKEISSGYQTESKKTRIIGSLSSKGASSLDVKRTALGAYYAELSKIIEQGWQENCIRYRNHIIPGVISVRFLVDKKGEISAPRFHDVVSASEIQKGFTLKSIQRAKIPPMPATVQKELEGEDLELIYNFYF